MAAPDNNNQLYAHYPFTKLCQQHIKCYKHSNRSILETFEVYTINSIQTIYTVSNKLKHISIAKTGLKTSLYVQTILAAS